MAMLGESLTDSMLSEGVKPQGRLVCSSPQLPPFDRHHPFLVTVIMV